MTTEPEQQTTEEYIQSAVYQAQIEILKQTLEVCDRQRAEIERLIQQLTERQASEFNKNDDPEDGITQSDTPVRRRVRIICEKKRKKS